MRVGYACKTTGRDAADTADLNMKSIKLGSFLRLPDVERSIKLDQVVRHNLGALQTVVHRLAGRFPEYRMYRIGSELLPLFDHHSTQQFYVHYRHFIERWLAEIGNTARSNHIRLSFHPDQFVVVASNTDGVAERGRHHIEKVTEIAQMMGYHGWHPQGFSINIHGGARAVSAQQLRDGIAQLSEQARNFLTLENDEFSWGISSLLLATRGQIAIVPDLHHHWISEGSYLMSAGPTINNVIDSWRGVTPKLHLAMSREHLVAPVCPDVMLPNYQLLRQSGLTDTKLRAHSDSPWNRYVLDYAYPFAEHFDIMWEGKDKDRGQQIIIDHFRQIERNQSIHRSSDDRIERVSEHEDSGSQGSIAAIA